MRAVAVKCVCVLLCVCPLTTEFLCVNITITFHRGAAEEREGRKESKKGGKGAEKSRVRNRGKALCMQSQNPKVPLTHTHTETHTYADVELGSDLTRP